MSRQTSINQKIIEQRIEKSLSDYLQDCIVAVENLPNKSLLEGMGELVYPEMKSFVRNKLRNETITLLKFYKEYPILNE